MRGIVLSALLLLLSFGGASAKINSWQGAVHLAAVPFIAGTGIYSDVKMLQDARFGGTKAAAVTNLSLLAVQAGLGATILFTDDDMPPELRIVHRIVGASVIASAIWLSIQGTLDKGVAPSTRYTAYGHTVLAIAPLVVMTF